ncbi:MAG: hypothetical protein ACREA0_02760 [bacterium]
MACPPPHGDTSTCGERVPGATGAGFEVTKNDFQLALGKIRLAAASSMRSLLRNGGRRTVREITFS